MTAVCRWCGQPVTLDDEASRWGITRWHDDTIDVDCSGTACEASPGEHHEPAVGAPVEVRTVLHELLTVLAGHEVTFESTDGQSVRIRLFTADEFVTAQHEAVDKLGAGSKVSAERAADLVRPIDIFAMTP